MKFFDYKFLILLGLTLVVYFLYREVEVLKKKVKKLDNNLIENNLNKNSEDVLQIELPHDPNEKQSNNENQNNKNNRNNENNENNVNNENNQNNIKENNYLENVITNENSYGEESKIKVINIPLKLENNKEESNVLKEEIINDTSSNSEEDIREYSNTSEKLEIYSNDDTENSESSAIESLEEITKKKTEVESSEGSDDRVEIDELKVSLNNLLKNKLAELQDMAKNLDIIIIKNENGKNKNKTKLELAKEIVNKK